MTAPPEHLADRPATPADLLNPPREFADPPALEDAALGLGAYGQPLDLLSELLRTVRLSGERIVAYAPARTFSIGFAGIGTLHLVDGGELALRVDGDPQASHLLASLPAAIVLRGARGPALEGLEVARRMIVFEMESPSQGSAVMIARILDLLFIQILRAWAAGTDAEPNWLAGALDPQIGPALSALHRDPGHDWTVAELARTCSLSRSAFAARFAGRVGKPPATYLAHVRLDTATDLLRDTPLPVTVIAEKVGYTSEAAFSRAFRHRYGTPPGRWRRDVRARHS
jgi:AraC-like DNA-binding protein